MQFLEGREASVSVCSRARRALFCLIHQHLCARAQGQQRDGSAPGPGLCAIFGIASSSLHSLPRFSQGHPAALWKDESTLPTIRLRLAPARPCRWPGPSPLAGNASHAAGRTLAHGRLSWLTAHYGGVDPGALPSGCVGIWGAYSSTTLRHSQKDEWVWQAFSVTTPVSKTQSWCSRPQQRVGAPPPRCRDVPLHLGFWGSLLHLSAGQTGAEVSPPLCCGSERA